MLDLKKNRIDYGEALSPPQGFETDFAVGTTYSLDFPVLASACMSLGLSASMDSSIRSVPLFLFHVLEKMKNRVLMFCQKGQIHNTGSQNELWLLLEDIIHQVNPEGYGSQQPVFHPKFWLIRYREKNGKAIRFRMIVSSRNCTDSSDWDVSVVLDSKKGDGKIKNASIRDFLLYLAKQDGVERKASARISELATQLSSIVFDTDSNEFDDYEFLPSGIQVGDTKYDISEKSPFKRGQKPDATEAFDRIMIISPFLSASGEPIKQFNQAAKYKQHDGNQTERCILLTRAEELYKLKPEHADCFKVWIAKQEVVDAEDMEDESIPTRVDSSDVIDGSQPNEDENVSAIKRVDIHAKIYMREKYPNRDLYIGSLNASAKALHQNVEILLRLHMRGYKNPSYYEKVFDELFGGNNTPFELVQVSDYQAEPEESENDRLRDTLTRFIRSIRKIKADVQQRDNLYSITFDVAIPAPEAKKMAGLAETVRISPLMLSHGIAKQIQPGEKRQSIAFEQLEKLNLSEFVRISVSNADQSRGVYSVLKVDETKGLPDREGDLLGKLISKNKDEFLLLAEFILSDSPEKTLLEARLAERSSFSSSAVASHGNSLYENMLRTAFSDPDRLRDMKRTIDLMPAHQRNELPKGLPELVNAFCKAVK
jgi:hypothetical protein